MIDVSSILVAFALISAPGDHARFVRLAREVAAIAGAGPLAPLSAEGSALLLVALVHVESSWRPEVERCEVVGPGGEIGLTQLSQGPAWGGHTRAEICASSRLQLELGWRHLAAGRVCGRDPVRWLGLYNSGACVVTVSAAKVWHTFGRIAAEGWR